MAAQRKTEPETTEPETGNRVETYEARRPDGTVVVVRHDIDAGTTEIITE